MTPEKLQQSTTTDGQPPRPGFETSAAPAPIDKITGQHEAYWVLTEAERAKGFIRPVRRSYKHVGTRPKYPLRDLTKEESVRFGQFDYSKFEAYPPDAEAFSLGRFWTDARLNSGCGGVTTMGQAIAETYARDPTYYGATMCVHCRGHFPVGAEGEFTWMDPERDTGEKVGT